MSIVETRRARKTDTKKLIQLEQVISVWGPPGSTGKTSIAFNLAYEFAELGKKVILIDLDTHNPSTTQLLGLQEPPPGLAAVARLIRQNRFDREQLDRLSISLKHKRGSFRIIPGLTSSRRWPEVTEETTAKLIQIAKQEFDIVLLDVSSELEADLISTQHPVNRNAAARTAINQSSKTIAVINENQNSITRYLNHFNELQELQKERITVLNKSQNKTHFKDALKQLTKDQVAISIPEDQPSFELAESSHLPLALARRKSPARTAIASLSHKLLECPPSVR